MLRNGARHLGRTVRILYITDDRHRIRQLALRRHRHCHHRGRRHRGRQRDPPFLEAIRQLRLGTPENVFYLHVTLVPFIGPSGEQKTKPTQHSVTEPAAGVSSSTRIVPDEPIKIPAEICACATPFAYVVNAADASSSTRSCSSSTTRASTPSSATPRSMRPKLSHRMEGALVDRVFSADETVRAGVIGKYVSLIDAYLSVVEALNTPASTITPTSRSSGSEAEDVEALADRRSLDGIVIPGGFGEPGSRQSLLVASPESTASSPRPCLGLQVMTIEYARNAGLANANSPSSPRPSPRSTLRRRRRKRWHDAPRRLRGPTRPRLEGRCAYGEDVSERHRHRYEFNPT